MKTIALVMLPRLVLALLFSAMLSGNAHAGGYFMTGDRLLAILNGTPTGKAQALVFIVAVHDSTSADHCSPDDLDSGEMRDMVKAKLEEVRPMLGLPAVKLVGSILKAAYPCKEPDKDPATGSGLAPRGLRL